MLLMQYQGCLSVPCPRQHPSGAVELCWELEPCSALHQGPQASVLPAGEGRASIPRWSLGPISAAQVGAWAFEQSSVS